MTYQIFANYENGTHDDMDVTDFAKVRRDSLKSFFVSKDHKPYFEIFYDMGQRPIYRRRTIIKPGTDTYIKIIMLGWQKKVGNENFQSINYIFPDGIIQKGKFEGIFSEPQWHKYEDENSTCECSGCNGSFNSSEGSEKQ